MKDAPREEDTDLQHRFEPLRTVFAILVLLLGFVASARAESGFGTITARTADGERFELVALSSDVHYAIGGLVAEASIKQRFSNHGDGWIEAQYLLPLPEGAAVHDLRVKVGERLIVGEIREREQARAEYVEAAASGQRTALVEADRSNLFRTAVANIGPGETIEVEVSWWQQIAYRDDRFRLDLPLTYTPRYRPEASDTAPAAASTTRDDQHADIAPQVGIHIALDPGLALSGVSSPTHALTVNRNGSRYQIALRDGAVAADRDFVLEWSPVLGGAPASAVLTEQRDGETYAMVMLLPRSELADPLPRELILVIDTSGSMHGDSLRQAVAALGMALDSLRPQDRFNVIQFNSTVEALFDESVPARAGDIDLARQWIARLRADGGTEMVPALARALRGKTTPGHVRQVVFATDGAVDDAAGLYALIDRDLGDSRLFPIGIGSAPNAQFIERAAVSGRGSSIVIRSTGELAARMQELFSKLDRPALRDLELNWPGVAETWPNRLPDLYAGEPLLVVARLSNVRGTLEARAASAKTPWHASLPLDRGANVAGIARLWAQRKIEHLEQSLDRGANADDVRNAVLGLALDHHLVTRYTSLLAVEKTPVRPLDSDLASLRIANGTPAGSVGFAATSTSAARQMLFGTLLLIAAALLAFGPRRQRIGRNPFIHGELS